MWRFAAAPDVAAKDLELRTREWLIVHWGETWGKEVGEVGKRERDSLVKDVLASLRPDKVVAFVRSIMSIRSRADADVRTIQPRGLKQAVWVDNLLGMLLEIEVKTKAMLISHFAIVAASEEFTWLLEGRGFNRELLDKLVDDAIAMAGTAEGCKDGGRLYEVSRTSSFLADVNPSVPLTQDLIRCLFNAGLCGPSDSCRARDWPADPRYWFRQPTAVRKGPDRRDEAPSSSLAPGQREGRLRRTAKLCSQRDQHRQVHPSSCQPGRGRI